MFIGGDKLYEAEPGESYETCKSGEVRVRSFCSSGDALKGAVIALGLIPVYGRKTMNDSISISRINGEFTVREHPHTFTRNIRNW